MRLINTFTLQLESFSSSKVAPPYAILSHTWGEDKDEVSFEEMKPNLQLSQVENKPGLEKIKMTCQLARKEHNLKYAWIDTCCIDKSSSAELSEAINSMFTWYRESAVCFAFLADWEPEQEMFVRCKWFTRGWTLQELVAPETIIFYDQTWQARGSKSTYRREIAKRSRISEAILTGETKLSTVPVAVRLSWAAERTTTREEDAAYCLLGIFDINMPMLYGEGHKAFRRLQEEIIKEVADFSIFAWKAVPGSCPDYMGILAPSPREFKEVSKMHAVSSYRYTTNITFSMSNRGVEFHGLLPVDESTGCSVLPVLHIDVPPEKYGLGRIRAPKIGHGVLLRKIGRLGYVRSQPNRLVELSEKDFDSAPKSFWAPKNFSIENSKSINGRELQIREPRDLRHPYFGLATVQPGSGWLSPFQKLLVKEGHSENLILHFEPDWSNEFPSFTLLCWFTDSPYMREDRLRSIWRCALVQEHQFPLEFESWDFMNNDIFCWADTSSVQTKALELAHFKDNSRIKIVSISLQSQPKIGNGHPQIFLDLRVEDGWKTGNESL